MKIIVNGNEVEIDKPSPNISDVLEALGLTDRPVVVELNGEATLPKEHLTTPVKAGARLEIVQVVAGG